MKKLNITPVLYLFFLFTLSGCVKLETEYTSVKDGVAMKLSVKKDNGKNIIIKAILSNQSVKDGVMVIERSNDCEYFDENNWICKEKGNVAAIEMKEGRLTVTDSDGKVRVFKSEKKLMFNSMVN